MKSDSLNNRWMIAATSARVMNAFGAACTPTLPDTISACPPLAITLGAYGAVSEASPCACRTSLAWAFVKKNGPLGPLSLR